MASTHTGLNVVRAYLRLGMGDSYNANGTGTIGWVDKVTLGAVTYDFVLAQLLVCDTYRLGHQSRGHWYRPS